MKPTPFASPLYVTRPLLPDLREYGEKLEAVWSSGWLTNAGRMHQELERALSDYLRAPALSLFNNGTVALLTACRALEVRGEVITTPFTFPATPHVVAWSGAEPVFCDVDPKTLTLDPARVESLITPRTTAILGVHVYGTPCDVEALQRVADRHRLKIIYDGAHAFGTEIDGRPISDFGDLTMFSFHATKLFHTAEGGALAARDPSLKARIDLLKNFGIMNETEVALPGINGKMNELQAALGLVVLRRLDEERRARSAVARVYRERLGALAGVSCLSVPPRVRESLQYFVIRIDAAAAGVTRDALYAKLREYNVIARRYFYPLCSEQPCYRDLPSARPDRLPAAHRAASEVLALPFYGALGTEDAERVCAVIEYELGQGSGSRSR
jgi:dTDP-4-amino-4,6-dideoxygalactose transaminase